MVDWTRRTAEFKDENPVEYDSCSKSLQEMRDYISTPYVRIKHYLNPLEVYSRLMSCGLSDKSAMRVSLWYEQNLFRVFEKGGKGISKILKTTK